jgi:hypothetical protein
MAIDTQEDESAREKTVREFEIADVGESRVGHGGERVITVGKVRTFSSALLFTAPTRLSTIAYMSTQTMNDSLSQGLTDNNQLHPCPPTHNTRPASPFFRHRPLGRAPSPPTWACYEQIPARSDLLGSSDSDSDSGEAADEDSLSDVDSSSSSSSSDEDDEEHDDVPAEPEAEADVQAEAEAEAAGLMDVESDKDDVTTSARHRRQPSAGDPEKRDKGKQRADDPPNTVTGGGKSVPVAPSRSRRPRGRRPPMSALRPILTIQRSQGFVWNQVSVSLFFSHSSCSAATARMPGQTKPCDSMLTTRRKNCL